MKTDKRKSSAANLRCQNGTSSLRSQIATANLAPLQDLIYEIRGCKVMLDSVLAELYGVEVKALNRAVKRNADRFPGDFMFQLTDVERENLRLQIETSNLRYQIGTANSAGEDANLRSQIATSSLRFQIGIANPLEKDDNLRSQIVTANPSKQTMRRFMPYVFTEQGVAMLSSVLNSPRAIEMNILIMRVFVKMRDLVVHQAPTLNEFKELKQMLMLHVAHTETRFDEHTDQINQILRVLDNLIEKPPARHRIGFSAGKTEGKSDED
jgi:hypothetical protein